MEGEDVVRPGFAHPLPNLQIQGEDRSYVIYGLKST